MGRNSKAGKKKKAKSNVPLTKAEIDAAAAELDAYTHARCVMAVTKVSISYLYALMKVFSFDINDMERLQETVYAIGSLFNDTDGIPDDERLMLTDLFDRLEETYGIEFINDSFGPMRQCLYDHEALGYGRI